MARDEDFRARRDRREGEAGYRGDGGEGVTFSFMGVEVSARGAKAALATLAVSSVGLILTALWMHHSEMERQENILGQQMSEMIYVMSLPQEKRDELNIAMPDSLRAKQRAGRRAAEEER